MYAPASTLGNCYYKWLEINIAMVNKVTISFTFKCTGTITDSVCHLLRADNHYFREKKCLSNVLTFIDTVMKV